MQIVDPALLDYLQLRELKSLGPPRNTGLERALGRVSGQVIRAFCAVSFEQEPGLFQTKSGQLLKVLPLHTGCSVYQTYPWNESASEKIGRYKETSTKATKMPMQIMMAGSTKLSMAVTRVETSSS